MLEAKGVSLWLEPAEPERGMLHSLIASLAQRHGGPAFPPHITVVGEMEVEDEALACERAAEVAASIHPFPVALTKVKMDDVYWRTLYLEAERSTWLSELHTQARTRFPAASKSYRPHLSLMYTDLDERSRKEIAASLPLALPLTVTARRLSVWRTAGPVRRWRRLAEFALADRRIAWHRS